MKRLLGLAIAVAMMCVALPSKAQIKLGVKGGLNVSDMSIDKKVFDSSNQTGFLSVPLLNSHFLLQGLASTLQHFTTNVRPK